MCWVRRSRNRRTRALPAHQLGAAASHPTQVYGVRAACAVAVVASAGCDSSGKAFDADATRQCLSSASGVAVDMDGWDCISHEARGGSYRVNFPHDAVVLAFNGTDNGAKRMICEYKCVTRRSRSTTFCSGRATS
jgi:hypothetical protein